MVIVDLRLQALNANLHNAFLFKPVFELELVFEQQDVHEVTMFRVSGPYSTLDRHSDLESSSALRGEEQKRILFHFFFAYKLAR